MVLTMFNWALAVSLDLTMPDKKIKVGVILYDLYFRGHPKYYTPREYPLGLPPDGTCNVQLGTCCIS